MLALYPSRVCSNALLDPTFCGRTKFASTIVIVYLSYATGCESSRQLEQDTLKLRSCAGLIEPSMHNRTEAEPDQQTVGYLESAALNTLVLLTSGV
jgi:hypothetical protein